MDNSGNSSRMSTRPFTFLVSTNSSSIASSFTISICLTISTSQLYAASFYIINCISTRIWILSCPISWRSCGASSPLGPFSISKFLRSFEENSSVHTSSYLFQFIASDSECHVFEIVGRAAHETGLAWPGFIDRILHTLHTLPLSGLCPLYISTNSLSSIPHLLPEQHQDPGSSILFPSLLSLHVTYYWPKHSQHDTLGRSMIHVLQTRAARGYRAKKVMLIQQGRARNGSREPTWLIEQMCLAVDEASWIAIE
jgi:hypothetical protein